jgi:hypothetical protein
MGNPATLSSILRWEGAIGDAKADISDLYNTVVEDLALTFWIEDPHGDERTLSAPIVAI